MSIYRLNGSILNDVYTISGTSLIQCYDLAGNPLVSSSDDDYDIWETDYQHTILQARDAWAAEYRTDSTIIPILVHTDQHRHLNSANKPTFDYLARAVKWQEVSAIINLGDVCGAVYNTTDLNAMNNCLSSLPRQKRIDVAGNHDVQKSKTGDGYAYSYLTAEQFSYLQETYFNNSQFGGNNSDTRYGVYGMEYMLDPVHHIKFCVFAVWQTGTAPDYSGGQPWYSYKLTSEAVEAMISMLSTVDDYDIVVLSHIQPYNLETAYYKPAVDGNEASVSTSFSKPGHLGYSIALDHLYADRKAKRAGTIKDIDGNTHSYDFSTCTSDLLCSLSGHSHTDYYLYSPDGTVPIVVFDAYGYDNYPLFMANIDRTRQRINVWKFDTANNVYNYQIPFDQPEIEANS